MPKKLSKNDITFYQENGYLFPIRVLPPDEAAGLRWRMEAFEAEHPTETKRAFGTKTHLLFPWLHDLVRHPVILDAVEDVIGPNILCWASGFFTKNPHDTAYVSWHQDSTYWGLEPLDIITAWVAFSPSVRANGCMRVIPKSHGWGQLGHTDTFAEGNLLSRGQEIAVEVDEAQAVDIELQPGEMSLHHVLIAHGSEPNRSDMRRIGFTIRYIPTYVRQRGPRTTATLVRGVDTYGNFDHEPRPKADYDADAVAYHAEVLNRLTPILYDGVAKPAR
jgi:non-heme Fe2+,alpha-ketoglutarate-dependent halogenase